MSFESAPAVIEPESSEGGEEVTSNTWGELLEHVNTTRSSLKYAERGSNSDDLAAARQKYENFTESVFRVLAPQLKKHGVINSYLFDDIRYYLETENGAQEGRFEDHILDRRRKQHDYILGKKIWDEFKERTIFDGGGNLPTAIRDSEFGVLHSTQDESAALKRYFNSALDDVDSALVSSLNFR